MPPVSAAFGPKKLPLIDPVAPGDWTLTIAFQGYIGTFAFSVGPVPAPASTGTGQAGSHGTATGVGSGTSATATGGTSTTKTPSVPLMALIGALGAAAILRRRHPA